MLRYTYYLQICRLTKSLYSKYEEFLQPIKPIKFLADFGVLRNASKLLSDLVQDRKEKGEDPFTEDQLLGIHACIASKHRDYRHFQEAVEERNPDIPSGPLIAYTRGVQLTTTVPKGTLTDQYDYFVSGNLFICTFTWHQCTPSYIHTFAYQLFLLQKLTNLVTNCQKKFWSEEWKFFRLKGTSTLTAQRWCMLQPTINQYTMAWRLTPGCSKTRQRTRLGPVWHFPNVSEGATFFPNILLCFYYNWDSRGHKYKATEKAKSGKFLGALVWNINLQWWPRGTKQTSKCEKRENGTKIVNTWTIWLCVVLTMTRLWRK